MKKKIGIVALGTLGLGAAAAAVGYALVKSHGESRPRGERSRINEIMNKIVENTGTDTEHLDDLIIRKEARLLVKAILMLQVEDPAYEDISIEDLCDDISYLDHCSGQEVLESFQTVYDMVTAENEYSTAADMFRELGEKMDATQARIVTSYVDNKLRHLRESGSDIFDTEDPCPDMIEPSASCQKLCEAVKDAVSSLSRLGKQYY